MMLRSLGTQSIALKGNWNYGYVMKAEDAGR